MIHTRGIKLFTYAGLSLFSSFALVGSGVADPSSSIGGRAFVENGGQWNSSARYLARFPGLNLWVTDKGAVYDFFKIERSNNGRPGQPIPVGQQNNGQIVGDVVSMEFLGQDSNPTATGFAQQAGYVNYLVGKDASKWATDLRQFGQVRMSNLYNGVDIVHYLQEGLPRYDLVVAPGADPSKIQMGFHGAASVGLASSDTINLNTSLGVMQHSGLFAYQIFAGQRRPVSSRFVMRDQNVVGIEVGQYDRTKPLIIDPLVYSTFLGGSGGDTVNGMAVNGAGTNAYVVGSTGSANFPTKAGSYQTTLNGSQDVFVTKMNTLGTAVSYSTYVGGSSFDLGNAIALDASGSVAVVGNTGSADFPTTAGAFQSTRPGATSSAFMFRLNSTGTALLASTYIGGSDFDSANSIKGAGAAGYYVAGSALSSDFPTTAGAFQTTSGGAYDGFACRMTSDGKTMSWGTYVGGTGSDTISTISYDASGIYLIGATNSTDYPTTAGAFQTTYGGGSDDVSVTKLNSAGSALVFSTYVGGSGWDVGAMGVIKGGVVHVTGTTESTNFPVSASAVQKTLKGSGSAFYFSLKNTGAAVTGSTYIGGTGYDYGGAVILDAGGNALIAGTTAGGLSGTTATTPEAFMTAFGGGNSDGFIAKLPAAANKVDYMSYFGGSFVDAITSVGSFGSDVFVAGYSNSNNLPTTAGAFQTGYPGGAGSLAGFVSRVTLEGLSGVTVAPAAVIGGTSATGTVILNGPAPAGGAVVTLSSLSAAATVPPSVFILPGDTMAIFVIGTDAVDTTVATKIKAARLGVNRNTSFTVASAGVSKVEFSPDAVYGGSADVTTGTVTLDGPAGPSGTVVALDSSNPGVAAPNSASVTVPAGTTTANFGVTHHMTPTHEVVAFSATVGASSLSADLMVHPFVPASLTANRSVYVFPQTGVGTVKLNANAPAGGTVVALSSSHSSIVVPASVTVAAGTNSATFTITSKAVNSAQTAIITASLNGGTATFTCNVKPFINSLLLSQTKVVGGQPGLVLTATLTLQSNAVAGGQVVTLSSTNTSVATVPASVTVPAGTKTATFPVTHIATTTTQTANIKAVAGGTTKQVVLTVTPGLLTGFTVDATEVWGASSTVVTGTVTINGNAPSGGIVCNLTSSDTGAATVPASITVAAGTSSKTFTVTHKAVADNATTTLTAAASGSSMTNDLLVKALKVTNLTLNTASVWGASSTAVTGTVTINGPAAVGGTTVSLNSSDTSAATVPGTVTVAAGASSATFTVTHKAVANDVSTTITASLNGSSATSTLAVKALKVTGLSLDAVSVWGASSTVVTGTVTINGPGAVGGTSVALSSNDTGAATVPATVTVAAGASTATFTVTHKAVANDANPVITASLNGSSSTATILVKALKVTGLSLSASTITGATGPVTGTVTINGPAAVGGTIVSLTSSDTTAVTVPATVTVPAGTSTATFAVTTLAVASDKTVTITASLNGSSATATIVDKAAVLISVSVSPTSVVGGSATTVTGTVTFDGPIQTGGRVVTLTSDLPGTASVPASVTVPAGATSATFPVTHFVISGSTRTVTITAVSGGVTKTCTLQVSFR